MFKRVISFVVVLAMLAAMCLIPTTAGAADLSSADLHFSVDFNNQSVVDSTGKYEFTAEVLTEEDLVYEYDETISRNVLVMDGSGSLVWRSVDGSSIYNTNLNTTGITVETYVYIDTDPDAFKANMVIIEANNTALHLQEYNDGTDLCSGFRAGDVNAATGGFSAANAYIESTFPHMAWTHIVGTSDGDTNKLYVDGVLSAVTERTQYLLKNANNATDDGIYLGESMVGQLFGATAFYGKVAFANIYTNSATDADVATLYKAATGKDVVYPDPTETPVVEPTVAPSNAPSDLYFGVDFTTESLVDLAGNHTFAGEVATEADMVYEYDEVIGKNVAVFDETGALVWRHNNGESLASTDMATNGITMEALVYIGTDPATYLNNMIIVEAVDTCLHLQEYNDGADLSSGFRAGDLDKLGNYSMANAYVTSTFPHMRWTHLVGTSDGSTNRMYIDGKLVAEQERNMSMLVSAFNLGDDGIYIGESMVGSQWGQTAFTGKMAFVKIYKEAVCQEQVITMCEATPVEPNIIDPIVVDWKIKEKTTVADFTAAEVPAGYTVTVTKTSGAAIADTDYMGTGMTLTITVTSTGEVAHTEVIVVKGDVSGDGVVKAADYMRAKRIITSPDTVTDAQFSAADISGDNAVKAADYMRIKRYINGLLDIYA